MKTYPHNPEPITMRSVSSEPLDPQQQLQSVAQASLSVPQVRYLCHLAYKMEYENKRAAAVLQASRKVMQKIDCST